MDCSRKKLKIKWKQTVTTSTHLAGSGTPLYLNRSQNEDSDTLPISDSLGSAGPSLTTPKRKLEVLCGSVPSLVKQRKVSGKKSESFKVFEVNLHADLLMAVESN